MNIDEEIASLEDTMNKYVGIYKKIDSLEEKINKLKEKIRNDEEKVERFNNRIKELLYNAEKSNDSTERKKQISEIEELINYKENYKLFVIDNKKKLKKLEDTKKSLEDHTEVYTTPSAPTDKPLIFPSVPTRKPNFNPIIPSAPTRTPNFKPRLRGGKYKKKTKRNIKKTKRNIKKTKRNIKKTKRNIKKKTKTQKSKIKT
jgi:histone H1/5